MDVIAHYDLLVDDNRYRQIPIDRTVRKTRICKDRKYDCFNNGSIAYRQNCAGQKQVEKYQILWHH